MQILTERMCVRFSKEEAREIYKEAKKNKLPVSQYLRGRMKV
jgi:hypothetical protein